MKFYSDNYLMNNIKEKDSGEKLVDVKKNVKKIIVKKVSVLNIQREKIFVKESVAKMLDNVVKALPKGYQIIIYDGYRPIKSQKTYFKNHIRKLRKSNPQWSEERIQKEASKYVANPESFCPHLSGGAVDVAIAKNKRQLFFGGFNLFKEKNIKPLHKKNRKMLADIMQKAGFVNYPLEWWHWSYGDRYWAATKKRKYTLYKEIK